MRGVSRGLEGPQGLVPQGPGLLVRRIRDEEPVQMIQRPLIDPLGDIFPGEFEGIFPGKIGPPAYTGLFTLPVEHKSPEGDTRRKQKGQGDSPAYQNPSIYVSNVSPVSPVSPVLSCRMRPSPCFAPSFLLRVTRYSS